MRMRALVAQCDRLKRIRVFLGIGLADVLAHEHVDAFDFVAYCGSGSNRACARRGARHPARALLATSRADPRRPVADRRRYAAGVAARRTRPLQLGLAREYLLEAVKRVRLSRKCIPTLRERVDQLHLIGDARSARDIQPAIREGHISGRSIK